MVWYDKKCIQLQAPPEIIQALPVAPDLLRKISNFNFLSLNSSKVAENQGTVQSGICTIQNLKLNLEFKFCKYKQYRNIEQFLNIMENYFLTINVYLLTYLSNTSHNWLRSYIVR